MQVQVVQSNPSFISARHAEASTTQSMPTIDRITSAIVWLSYTALISAGVTVMTW